MDDGEIFVGNCNCPAEKTNQCKHVACLLYMVEELSHDRPAQIDDACTSKQQAWGVGSTRINDPQALNKTDYGAVLPDNRFADYDPRPLGSSTTKEEVDWFINRYERLKFCQNFHCDLTRKISIATYLIF
jgi:hypothetical protein